MRILIVCPAFPPAFIYGGTPLTAFGLAKGLQDLGQEVLVVTTNANGADNLEVALSRVISYAGVPVIYHPRWGRNSYFYSPALGRYLKELGPRFDLALVRGNWGYINLTACRSLSGKMPVFLYPEGIFDAWAFRHHYYTKTIYWHLIEKYNYKRATGVIALTRPEAEQIKIMGIAVPIEIIPNGVFLEEFEGQGNCVGLEQHKTGRPLVLFLGRLHLKKGIDILLKAISLIALESRPLLVIAGEGDKKYKEQLKDLVWKLGIEKDVMFAGLVTGEKKLYFLKKCAILVLPSRSEGLPVAVLEAMACRKPVVITPQCNLPEVAQWQAGFVVDGEAGSIAAAINKLVTCDSLQARMGKNAYALVKARFTWSVIAQQSIEYFAQIVAT